jgi:hypothetical protein
MKIGSPPIPPNDPKEFVSFSNRLYVWCNDVYNYLKETIKTYNVTRVATSYSATNDDLVIAVTDTSAPRTITIPSSSIKFTDRVFKIYDESGLSGTNNITISTEGSETINGSATYTIATNYGYVHFISNGSNLFKVG